MTACKRSDDYPFRRTYFAWPYLIACAALALGELLGFAMSGYSAAWPLMLFATVLSALIGYGWEIRHWPLVTLLLLGAALAMRTESLRARVFDAVEYSSSPFAAELHVDRVLTGAFDTMYNGVPMRVIIRGENPPRPAIGERWLCSGWLERRARVDRARRILWVSGRGACAEKRADDDSCAFIKALRRFRSRLLVTAGYGLERNPAVAKLVKAIALGERSALSADQRRMFVDAGTVHVFAISGLHIGVIAWGIVYLLMIFTFFPLRWIALPMAPILGSYIYMIGMPPSALRAGVMAILYFSAPMFFRRPDGLVAWAITFLGFHLWNPALLFSVGSLMSFTVMLGILLFVRWAEAFKSETLVRFGVTSAAWAAGVGISAHVFARFTVGGLAANLLLVPIAGGCVVLGLLGAVIGLFSPWLGAHFNNACALLISAMSGVSGLVAGFPWSSFEIAPWSFWQYAAWYAVLVLTLYLIRSVYLHRKEYL